LPENFEEKLEEKMEENRQELEEKINENKFVIKIPEIAVKEDLHDLKEFILSLESGDIKIFLDLRGQEIDTKIGLKDLTELNEWIKIKW
jgi:SepF-like predicted cell division protein (DUF552 family)